jgi:hypothetical protein
MAAGSLAPNSANEIKQAKLALVGLAGQDWPISNTPQMFADQCKVAKLLDTVHPNPYRSYDMPHHGGNAC